PAEGNATLNCFANAEEIGSALPIVVLTATDLEPWLEAQPAAVRRWVEATGFRADPSSTLLLPGEDGAARGALAGVSDPADPLALAHLPVALPMGTWRLSPDQGRRVDAGRAILGWGLGAYQYERYKRATRSPARLVLEGAADVSQSYAEL